MPKNVIGLITYRQKSPWLPNFVVIFYQYHEAVPKVSSFDFKANTVRVNSAYTKNKRTAVLPLRPDTAAELQTFLAGRLPGVKVFGGTYKQLTDKTACVLKADLADAGIAYVDAAERYADFHCLRHTTGSLLAASGVHPKVAQSIMRHSDINLTTSIYTHTLRGRESDAFAGKRWGW